MGFRLWDPESEKIVGSQSVFFDESKMHKKPVKIVEIRRVVFQEEGPAPREVPREVCASGQAPPSLEQE